MKKPKSKVLLVIVIALSLFTIMPIIAPIAAKIGLEIVADAIYWFYQWFCHQRPWRSYHLFDYQLAMDARMMLMFGSMTISGWFIYLKDLKPLKKFDYLALIIVFILPLAVDGSVQMLAELTASENELPFYESTNFIRSVVGIIFGIGVGFGILPLLGGYEQKAKVKDYAKWMVLTFVLSVLFMLVVVIGWNLTSDKYKPSSFLIDHTKRFPGYNYEITTSGGHSTTQRWLRTYDEEKYVKRAEFFNKEELLKQYSENK